MRKNNKLGNNKLGFQCNTVPLHIYEEQAEKCTNRYNREVFLEAVVVAES